ncbi:MAG: hypothetical protein KDA81_17785, partial [Planctomycetaceae bacterium]|nr:hypothetical protein [Planctomycetaceae bacterium]
TSSGTFVAAGAALYLNGSLTVTGETLFLQGALETGVAPVATWAGPVEISGGSSLMLVDSPGDTLVVSGDITGSDGLTISTDPGGLVQFTGIQSYSGTTNVSGANLRMDGMSTGSDFVVTSGLNLSGSGSIAGAVTVQSGGQLLPGTSPGIISTGNLDLQTGSTLTAEVLGYSTAGTDYDQVDVTGTVTLAGALNLTGAPAAAIGGESITLINNDGSDAVIGTFSNAPVNGSTVTFNGQDWRILYDGGDGNDVVLVFGDAELSIDNVSQAEGTGGSTVFTFTVTLDSAVGAAFSVPYTIAGGSANPGEDFSAILTGSLLFTGTTSGETSTIEVTVTTDDKVELNEDFTVTLGTISGSSVITVTNSVGTGTIQNDDSATLSISDVSVVEGDSGTTDLIFTVSLDHDVDAAVGATVDTADGTATTADGDYVAITGGSVSLSGVAASPSTVTVTVNGDVTLESDETLSVLLSSLTSGGRNVTFGTATAVGTIIDDDRPTVDLSVSAAAGTEADTTVITVTVTSSSPVSGNQTVDLDVAGTGITTNDYILSATTLTINDTETTATATFTVQNDTVVEALETAVISLTNLSSGIRVGSVTSQNIDITDNDAATLSIDDVSVAEGNAGTAALVFTVTLTGDIDTGISVDFASADAMADSSDYTAVTGTLNFAGTTGETQTVTIDVNGDSVVELDETLSLVLSNLQAAGRNVTLSKASGTGTITNDDSATLAINDATIVEGDSGTTTVSLTVTLTGSVDQAFTVGYQTADDAAVAGSDYTAVTGGVLNFAGTDGEMVTLDVNISPDGLVELDEQFLVDLLTVSAGGRSITLADAQGAVTILNDDSPVAVDLSTSVSTATEADQTQVTLTVTAAGAVVGDQTVTVAVTGVAATDFVLSDTTITIPDGQTTGSVTFTIVDDALVELPETATVTISSPSLGVTIGTASQDIAITDNDAATLTISDVSHTEGDSGTTIYTFEITLDSAVDGMFSVDVATADGSAATASGDYFGISGSVDFDGTAGEVKTVEIIVNGDEIVELDETFVVNLSNVSAGGRNVTIADSQGVGTITNDDAATLSINSVSIAEGDSGSSALTFTVTLDSAVDDTVTVNVDSSDGTATTADSDYTANTGSVLTFVGNAGETQTFTVQVMGDTTPEQVETLLATLSNVQANGRAVTIAQAQGTGTIVDDDGAALTLSSDVVGGTEALGTVITITVTADAAVSGAQTVDLVVSGVDSADYLLSGATVTIADGATTGTATFTVQDDAVVELLETAVISLANPTAGVSIATSNTLSLTITDNDSATLSIDDVTIAESNSGTTTATFTVTLDASADADVTVDFTTAGDTATVADSDYAAASGTLTFPAGSAAGSTQTITVDITGDVKVEADETFFVNLSNVQSGGRNVTIADAQGVATITNDDSATISISDVTLNEGNAGTTTFTFTATLSGEVDTAVSVDYATQDGTATVADNDYAAAAATTLTFAANAGTGNQTLTFDITVNGDVAQEVLETFLVNLSNLTFDTGTRSVTISDATGVGSIVNDDGILVNLGATASTGTEADGTSITLVITAASPVVGNQTVDLVVSGTGIDSADYTLSTVTIQIPDGQTIGTATFTVANDTVVEPTETATISLTNLSAGISAGAISSVNMDITSDDAATVSINDVTLAEGNSGETLFVFTVTLDNAVSGGFSVDYSTADGTTIPAVVGTDYTAVSGTLTFAGTAGETMQISVPVLGDLTSEEA